MNRAARRRWWSWPGLAVLAGVLLVAASPTQAGVWQGLDINIESNWPGCGYGGYLPVLVSILNKGQPVTLKITCTGEYQPAPEVTRTVAMETGRLQFHLLVPCVSGVSSADVKVYVDGAPIQELGSRISIPNPRGGAPAGPAMVLISEKDANWSHCQAALDAIVAAGVSGGGGYSPYPSGGAITTAAFDHRYVAPQLMPREWQAYTGLDLVAVAQPRFAALPADVRTAILNWVDTGGTLLLFSVGQSKGNAADDAGDLAELVPLLQLAGAADRHTNWDRYSTANAGEDFYLRSKLHGMVLATSTDPFDDFDQDEWTLVWNTLGQGRWEWEERNGYSARMPISEFLDFLIPSVHGVPVIAFLVLITIFSVVIGPVNYLYLWKQRRLYLLVVTIPAIALVTSLSLFGYSIAAHGFGTRSRIRSLTVLDQGTNSLVQTSRVSLYSGLAPSSGLEFSRDSAVMPLWPQDGAFESGVVDWTESQHFRSGWLRSRTRSQFVITTHRAERGRLTVEPKGEGLSVANGLEWDIRALVVTDDAGKAYFGESLDAGDAGQLARLTDDDAGRMAGLLQANAPQRPANAPAYSSYNYRYGYYEVATAFSTSLMEQELKALAQSDANSSGPIPRRYVAVLEESPGVDVGIDANEEVPLHVLVGYY